MIYLDYEILKKKYHDSQKRLDELIEEKEFLFSKTQPQGVQSDKEKVKGGEHVNAFDSYLIEKERRQIDERIMEAEEIIKIRAELMKTKETELRASEEIIDKIYASCILDKKKIVRVAIEVGYSESQIYRILEKIREEIKDARKCEVEEVKMLSGQVP